MAFWNITHSLLSWSLWLRPWILYKILCWKFMNYTYHWHCWWWWRGDTSLPTMGLETVFKEDLIILAWNINTSVSTSIRKVFIKDHFFFLATTFDEFYLWVCIRLRLHLVGLKVLEFHEIPPSLLLRNNFAVHVVLWAGTCYADPLYSWGITYNFAVHVVLWAGNCHANSSFCFLP